MGSINIPSVEDGWPINNLSLADSLTVLKAASSTFSPSRFSLMGVSLTNLTASARVMGILGPNLISAVSLADNAANFETGPSASCYTPATSDFAFETWFCAGDKPAGDALIAQGSDGGTPPDGLQVFILAATGTVKPIVGDGTTTAIVDDAAVDVCDGDWHHIMVLFNRLGGNGTVSLYIDGVLDGTPDVDGSTAIGAVGGTTQTLKILGGINAATYFAGVAMYTRTTAATATFDIDDVTPRYNSGVPLRHTGIENGLAYYWKAVWEDTLYPSGTTTPGGTVAFVKMANTGANPALERIPVGASTLVTIDLPQAIPYNRLVLMADGAGVLTTLHGFSN